MIVGDAPAGTGMVYEVSDRLKPPNVLPPTTILADSGASSTGMSRPLNSSSSSRRCPASGRVRLVDRELGLDLGEPPRVDVGSSVSQVSRIQVTYWTPIW